jgi:hypothetical protein
VADIVIEVLLNTGWVVTGKLADVAFAGMVTLTGIVATEALLLVRLTIAPPAGAGPFSATVPVEEVPPLTEVGLRLSELRVAGPTVRFAVLVLAPQVAETVTEMLVDTGLVVTVNVAVIAFAATVTLVGTVAADGLLLVRPITAPFGGAGPLRVTVPVDEPPPSTELGFKPIALSPGPAAVTVSVAVVAWEL